MKYLQKLAAVLTFMIAAQTFAASDVDTIRSKLKQARPDLAVDTIEPSVVDGIYEASIGGGQIIYVTAKGDFFFLGDLFSIGSN